MSRKSKNKLTRPNKIYQSLSTDPKWNINQNQLTIGIHDKQTDKITEKSFKNYDMEDMTKYEEIFYYKLNGEYIWNGKERLDLLFGSGNTNKTNYNKFIKKYYHKLNNKKIINNNKNNRYTFDNNINLNDDKKEDDTSSDSSTDNLNNNTSNSNSSIITIKQKYRYLIVLDYEATCNKKYNPKPQEIIEWPALVIDTETNKIISKFHYYIKPSYHPKLTEFCTQLTGITQHTIETKGKTIEFVLEEWNKWCSINNFHENNSIIITCGNWDLETCWKTQKKYIKSNKNNGILLNKNKFINIKNIYRYYFKESKCKGMMYMLARLNIEHQGRHHSGIDDVKNICQIVLWFLRKGVIFDETLNW